jgi:hypothetical protein
MSIRKLVSFEEKTPLEEGSFYCSCSKKGKAFLLFDIKSKEGMSDNDSVFILSCCFDPSVCLLDYRDLDALISGDGRFHTPIVLLQTYPNRESSCGPCSQDRAQLVEVPSVDSCLVDTLAVFSPLLL